MDVVVGNQDAGGPQDVVSRGAGPDRRGVAPGLVAGQIRVPDQVIDVKPQATALGVDGDGQGAEGA